jgi:hypothetical protein
MRHSLVLIAVLGAGCRMGTLSQEDLDRQYPVVRLTTLSGEGLDESIAALRESVGGGKVRITSLSFNPERTSMTAQNPRAPSDFDNYTFWQGDVTKSAVSMSGDDEQRYTARLFDLDSVPFDKLGPMALQAMKALPLDGGHVAGVSVDFDDGRLVIDVSLESERRRGNVKLDASAAVLSAERH